MTGNLNKLLKIALIIIALAATAFIVFSMHVFSWHSFFVFLSMIPLIALLVFVVLYKWVNTDSNQFNDWLFHKPITNASLTCKNGHTSRVWVDYSGGGWDQSDVHGIWGPSYRIGGSPTITPETCPECGAQWLTPQKHHEHKLNLDEQYNNKY